MNIERIRAILEQSAEQMLELAQNIGQHGKPLTIRQRQLLRCVTLPVIQDICDGMMINHLQGISQDLSHIANELAMISFE